jgi:acylphosphatase
MAEKIRGHIFISGKVQGVFFRHSTKEKADEFGLFGWVKNLDDGKVEIVAEGDKENVEKMAEWAKKGPRFARVESVIFNEEDYAGEFKEFKKI